MVDEINGVVGVQGTGSGKEDGNGPTTLREVIPGIFLRKRDLLTANPVPGVDVYGEHTRKVDGVEYRVWNPTRSKLAALIHLTDYDPSFVPLRTTDTVLYLGASTGTTVSHVSDILTEGAVFAVEVSRRSSMKLADLAGRRRNIVPILHDAGRPEGYMGLVSRVDLVYQDVAQRHQVEILKRNARMFLKPDGAALLFLKTRSVDASAEPETVRLAVERELGTDFRIEASRPIERFHKDHWAYLLRPLR